MRVGIVASRFNAFIVEQLLDGALSALKRNGIAEADVVIIRVPGAFELPLAAERMAASGRIDAVVALGAVIRGDTPHFDYVAGECARGLREAAQRHGIPVAFGVLTTENVEQALTRSGTGDGNKGFDAAVAAIETARALAQLKHQIDALGTP